MIEIFEYSHAWWVLCWRRSIIGMIKKRFIIHLRSISAEISLATGEGKSWTSCKAVNPIEFLRVTSIPASNRRRTTSTFPQRAASWSAVPIDAWIETGKPASRSASTTFLNKICQNVSDKREKSQYTEIKVNYCFYVPAFGILSCDEAFELKTFFRLL